MDRDHVLDEWRMFIDRLPTRGEMKPFILESWERSRQARVDAEPAEITFRQVPEEELRRRQAERRELIALARPHLRWLSASLGSTPHAAYLTDQDGIVLHAEGDEAMKTAFGIIPGYDWSEKQMGTNGAGTAIAADRPVAVVGPEHYSTALHEGTCTGAPIHNPDGATLGAIDLSTSVADGRPERLSLVAHAAFAIETQLARQQAEQDHRRTSEFLATLAHELRNPLAPLCLAVELLDQPEDGSPSGRDVRRIIRDQVHQITRLIDDLNDAAHADRGKLSLRKQKMDLRTVVQRALDTVRPQCAQASVNLDTDITGEPLPVHGDPARLTQAVVNLLNNACKFTPADGQVRLIAGRDGEQAVVRVQDTGPGIEPDKLTAVFEFFVQLDKPRNTSKAGLGIGLALVRSLVKMHGGEVTAHSEGKGHGSEFTITLPLAAVEQEADPADLAGDAPESARDSQALRILLVEDSEPVGRIFTELLRKLGHQVEWVRDAEEALRRVRQIMPDVIFSDLSLPRVSGYELVTQIREQQGLEGIQMIAITGYDTDEHRQRALAAGFDRHLVKPVNMNELQQVLESVANGVRTGA